MMEQQMNRKIVLHGVYHMGDGLPVRVHMEPHMLTKHGCLKLELL